jgi:hypothetical protein
LFVKVLVCSAQYIEEQVIAALTLIGVDFCVLWQYEYLWADGVRVKKPIRLTAPEYINALCDWIESQVGGHLAFFWFNQSVAGPKHGCMHGDDFF